jgi:hypothetical protein
LDSNHNGKEPDYFLSDLKFLEDLKLRERGGGEESAKTSPSKKRTNIFSFMGGLNLTGAVSKLTKRCTSGEEPELKEAALFLESEPRNYVEFL